MKKKLLSVLLAVVLVLSFSLVTAVPVAAAPDILNVIPFTLYDEGIGVAEWSTKAAHSGIYSVKLTAPTSADYAKVKMACTDAFADFTAPSFYYKISDDAVATTEDIGATWPIYVRSGETVASEYLSPYPVIHIFDGSTEHWIIGQPWAESTKVDWTVWDNAQASTVYTEALWHMETFVVDPGIADVPAGWGPLSYWTTTAYPQYNVVDVGIGLGLFTGLTGQQSAYVDDLTIDTTTYDLEYAAYTSIQAAIDAATAGDTISVAPGTYAEEVNINKNGLVLKSTSGAEVTTIEASSAVATVDIIGAEPQFGLIEDCVVDGFTVINNFMEGPFPVVVRFQHADGCVVKNCVILGPSILTGPHMSGVVISGEHDIGSNNVLENCAIRNCWNGFVAFGLYADGNIIRNCIVEENSNGGCIEYETKNTVVQYNDIINNLLLGIYIDEQYWAPSENITINYNNIYGNGFGIKADYQSLTTPVDATNNWWGNASGPQPDGAVYTSYGDAVSASAYVDYESWLLEPVTEAVPEPPTFDKTLALKDGWTLVSTDKGVTTGTTWVEPTLAYTYIPGSGYAEATATDLEPVSALYVKTVGGGGVSINYAPSAPGVSSKDLAAGWNLISSGTIADAGPVLSPLRDIAGEGTGLTTLVSQGSYNQYTDAWYIDATEWTNVTGNMNPFDGYWIYMNAAKSFGVISD